MNKKRTLALTPWLSTALVATLSLPVWASDTTYPTLVHSIDGAVVHNNYQECWGTGPNDVTTNPSRECGQGQPAAPAPQPVPMPVAAAPMAPAPAPVAQAPAVITLSADALFDFNKAILKPEGKHIIARELEKTQYDGGQAHVRAIRVIGYTDSIGSRAYNDKLSLRRADAVKAYLVSRGIPANRIHAEGRGMNDPVASNKTKEGRAQNRRAEIRFEQQ